MNPDIPNEPLSRRRMLAAGLGLAGGGLLAAAGCRPLPQSARGPASNPRHSPFFINLEPDPGVPAKTCRGWVCIKAGEPGQWMAYGALIA